MKNRNPSSFFFKKMEIVIEEENLKFRGRIYITGSGDVDVIRTEGKNGIVLVNNTEQQNLRSEKRWQWEWTVPYRTPSASLTLPSSPSVPELLTSSPSPSPICSSPQTLLEEEELCSAPAPPPILPQMTNPLSSPPLSTTSTPLPIWVAPTPPSPPMPLLASRWTNFSTLFDFTQNYITFIQFEKWVGFGICNNKMVQMKWLETSIKVDVLYYCYIILIWGLYSFDSGYWERKLYLLLARMSMGRKLQLLPWPRVPPLVTIAISYQKLTKPFGKM